MSGWTWGRTRSNPSGGDAGFGQQPRDIRRSSARRPDRARFLQGVADLGGGRAGTRDRLGIGGSATNDGGAGILEALGARLVPADDGGVQVDLNGMDPRLPATSLRIACDVTNPLLGDRGAAVTYGPQKGATPADVAELDRR